MELLKPDFLAILDALWAGFLYSASYRKLASYSHPDAFSRLTSALIFSKIIDLAVWPIHSILIRPAWSFRFGVWSDFSENMYKGLVALCLALLISYIDQQGWLMNALQKLSITNQTSFSSEWHWAFSQNTCYAVLHLKDERRLYGFPTQWPDIPSQGEFVIDEAQWLSKHGDSSAEQKYGRMVIPSELVSFVEFVAPASAARDGHSGKRFMTPQEKQS